MSRQRPRLLPTPRGARRLDPSRPLFVVRRIAAGVDENGAPKHLWPGESFDPSNVREQRVRTLFATRFIDHVPPRSAKPADAAGPTASSPADPESAPVPVSKPAKQPRSSARS